MDFGLNEQQQMMQTMARDFLAAEYPDKVLKEMAKDEKGYTPELWKKMQETGLLALSLPEQYGGIGDLLDLSVVLMEMGRVCFINPYFTTIALAGGAFMAAGTEEQKQKYLGAISEGKSIATVAIAEKTGKYTTGGIQMTAKTQGADYVLSGTKLFVPDGQNADVIIAAARTSAEGITLFVVPADTAGVKVTPMDVFSGDKQAQIDFNGVKVPAENILGQFDRGWPVLEKILMRANVCRCAEMVGIMEQALKFTLDYAKERVAYGHPIGAFQSIQHRAADMLMDQETSRFLTLQAAWRINQNLPAAREVAIAKAWVSRACQRLVHSAHQIHGAIGFTQDHILHYYTKRARSYEFSFGGADEHLEKLAEV